MRSPCAFAISLVSALAASTAVPAYAQVNSTEGNALIFQVNGTEYARISGTAGNVGIGSTSPPAKLSVTGASSSEDNIGVLQVTTGTGGNNDEKLVFGVHDGDFSWIQPVKPGTAYRNLSLAPSGGNVGIGTTGPKAKLDVTGDVSVSGIIDVGHTALACSTTISGSIRYETTSDTLQICTSAGWKSLTSSTVVGGTVDGAGSANHVAYWSDSDTLNYDNGQFYWDDTNNWLGIGGTPLTTLQVSGTVFSYPAVKNAFAMNGTSNYGIIGNSVAGNTWSLGYSALMTTLQTPVLTWNASGNVGIGTTAPSSSVHVGDGTGIRSVIVHGASSGAGLGSVFTVYNGASPATGYFGNPSAVLGGAYDSSMGVGGYFGLKFYTLHTQRMMIDTSGNLGIGITAPESTLNVSGTIEVDGSNTTDLATYSASKDGGALRYYAAQNYPASNNYYRSLDIVAPSFNTLAIIRFMNSKSHGAAPTESMRVHYNGNVGIGTETPISNLDVSGTARVTGVFTGFSTRLGNYGGGHANIYPANNADIYFSNSSGTPLMMIDADSTSNIGIGNTAPSAKLEVAAVSTSPSIRVGNLMMQSYGQDNEWISQNLYFGGSWRYGGNGYGIRQYFSDGKYYIDTAPLNSSGAGAAATATTRFTLDNSGNVGIGRSPRTLLDVGTTDSTEQAFLPGSVSIQDWNGANVSYLSAYDGAGGNLALTLRTTSGGSLRNAAHFAAGGNMTVYGASTSCNIGNGSGATNCTSDARLKIDIKPIKGALDKIAALDGVTFHWKDPQKSQREYVGVIAQNVEKVFPQVVDTISDTTLGAAKTVDYAALVAPLIEAIKELKADNDDLRVELKAATDNNVKLEQRLDQLEQQLVH